MKNDMENKRSKTDKIRGWLKSGRSITPKEAYEMFGSMRLAPIILNLKKEGLNIINSKKAGEFAEYKIVEIGEPMRLDI